MQLKKYGMMNLVHKRLKIEDQYNFFWMIGDKIIEFKAQFSFILQTIQCFSIFFVLYKTFLQFVVRYWLLFDLNLP